MHRDDPSAGPTFAAFRKLCDSARLAIAFALPSALDARAHREHRDSKMLLLDFTFDVQDSASFTLEDAAIIDLNACAATPKRGKSDTGLLCVRVSPNASADTAQSVLCRADGFSYRCAVELQRYCFDPSCACGTYVEIDDDWLPELKRNIAGLQVRPCASSVR